MNPPKSAGWLTLDADLVPGADDRATLCSTQFRYVIDRPQIEEQYPHLLEGHQRSPASTSSTTTDSWRRRRSWSGR